MSASLAQVLREHGQAYLRTHALSVAQARVWRAIVACRTPALGGQLRQCDGCGVVQPLWHACRNRHCPSCQTRQRDAWRQARMAELLEVPYTHVVFTLPHEINALARSQLRWTAGTLLACAAATLSEMAADPRWLGATPAMTLVLHTWTQDLRLHLHVHALVSCGGLTKDGQWKTPSRSARFLFPVQALSRVFRGKFMAELRQAEEAGRLRHDPQEAQRQERRAALWRQDWVVYAKTPLAGPAAVLDYLSRYTHRTAIGNERIVAVGPDAVRIRVRDREHPGAGKRTIALAPERFIGRFLQHVLPLGLKRIRHYGLLASAVKARRLADARQALNMPAPNAVAREQAAEFMRRVAALEIERCTTCNSGRWLLRQALPPERTRALWCRSTRCATSPPARAPPTETR